jgi:hypothetical protein
MVVLPADQLGRGCSGWGGRRRRAADASSVWLVRVFPVETPLAVHGGRGIGLIGAEAGPVALHVFVTTDPDGTVAAAMTGEGISLPDGVITAGV